MTLETFFEKFDQFADAPDAVAKMRELVLQLAVQGKLVEQRTKELSARDCVRKANKSLVDVAPDELVETPAGWIALPLGCLIASNTGGGTPSKQNPSYWNGPVPWASVKDVQSEKYLVSTIDSISKEGLKDSSSNLIPPNRLIVVTRMGLGKLAINTIPVAINQDLRAIEPTTALDLDFAYLLFKSLKMVGSGVTVKGITVDKLHAMPVLLPPLAEQKRIVAKVDELMALCDRLEAQQQERDTQQAELARASLARFAEAPIPENLQFIFHKSYDITPADLRKSILTLAVQGKLVPQDPNDEPADEILAAIAGDVAKAIRAKRMRNSRPIPAYEDEFPFNLPIGWAWATLGILTAAEDGAMCDGPFGSKLKTEHYIPTKGYAVLRLGNIGVGYFIHGKEGHISREHFESLPSNHTAPGDLLVAGLADPLVRCCEIPPDIGPAVNKSDCFRVRLSKYMERSYIRHYLNSPIAKAFAAEENHGMTRERINLANAKALPVSVPPLAEQRRIVAKVDQLMALVDELETQLAASRATAANLLSALVGELTGTVPSGKVSASTSTGRRGRPKKS
jgi:type I restriction enzyme S subunit